MYGPHKFTIKCDGITGLSVAVRPTDVELESESSGSEICEPKLERVGEHKPVEKYQSPTPTTFQGPFWKPRQQSAASMKQSNKKSNNKNSR
eukprot:GHVP01042045.1.p1 GENE.GHVP01042045.1~~GHVP01042045.1.p1  ORF type:complete len:101 (+),score=10.22 GHVP01042045.1:31-303(+)